MRWFQNYTEDNVQRFLGFLKGRLAPTDIGFAALRLITFLGGAGWLVFSPINFQSKHHLSLILTWFFIYSSLLYMAIFILPRLIRKFYLAALVLDLGFIYLLVKNSGGIQSNFFLAFYLLVALHAFYYGLWMGLLVAVASSYLYLASDWADITILHWTDLTLRHALLFLVALSLGLLSEKERRDRQKIENLYTTLKDTQEQLVHSEKLASIGTLAAGVAHEINNPLDGIQNCIRSILQEPDDKKKAGHYLGLIQEGLNRIENIVRKLLDFARPSKLKMENIQANDLLGNSLELVAHRFNNPGIKLNKDFAGNLPLCRGDSHYLQQVFLNIILNALDAMPAGGALTVKTSLAQNAPGVSLPNTRIEVAVSDTGCGIPQENLSKIFDPFFTTKGVGEGTGLGLAVCTGIIKEHRGEIKVKSAVGKGSTFTVLLPVNPAGSGQSGKNQTCEAI